MLALAISVVAGAGLAACSPKTADPITGVWQAMVLNKAGEEVAFKLEIEREGDKITGSVDPHDKALLTREKLKDNPGFNFPLLSDPDHRVIDRYGLLNDKVQRPIPHPTTLVIDRKGIVRWRFTEVDYRVRPSNEDILKQVSTIETAEQKSGK
jgi:alkyl hydroperoxide reductase subunit AhpC